MDHNTLLGYSSAIPAPAGGAGGSITLPVIGTTLYPSDTGALCVDCDLRQNYTEYLLTYKFSSDVPIAALRSENPLARSPIYTVSFQKFQKPLIYDLSNDSPGNGSGSGSGSWDQVGKAVLNSAGEPFENVITVDSSWAVIQIEQNYATYDLLLLEIYMNSVNADYWTPPSQPGTTFTFAPYTCRMDDISVTPKEENQTPYQALKYKILYNPDCWHPYKVLDCGYHQLATGGSGGGTQLVSMTDKYGNPAQKPMLLNGSGYQTDTPEYLSYQAYNLAFWQNNIP
jgi:hypothetical protein